jgi:hypothetical protein
LTPSEEAAVIVAGIAALAGWLTFAATLSWFMEHRGYDRTAWLVTALLFGPVALMLAVNELFESDPRQPHTVVREQPGSGALHLLVVLAGEELATARVATEAFGDRLHRLVLARVLPYDGPADVESDVVHQLRGAAGALGRPAGAVLLFGAPARAIADFAMDDGFTVVVSDREVRGLTDRLPQGVLLLSGLAAFPRSHSRVAGSRPGAVDRAA